MQHFKAGDLCHYNIGSDVYPAVVTHVSRTGKTIKVKDIVFAVKPTISGASSRRLSLADVVSWKPVNGRSSERLFSRRLQPDGTHVFCRHSSVLGVGFARYSDPHF